MLTPELSVQQWLMLTHEMRRKLVLLFNIPRSTGSYVENNVVKSDGHTHDDLKSINVASMQSFLGSDEIDFYKLFDMVLGKVEEEQQKEVEKERKKLEKLLEKRKREAAQASLDAIKTISKMAEIEQHDDKEEKINLL